MAATGKRYLFPFPISINSSTSKAYVFGNCTHKDQEVRIIDENQDPIEYNSQGDPLG
jgi:hypothetical protein